MIYLSEFVGCFVFLLGGYAYTCNITLKNTLIGTRNYIELAFAWALSVGIGIAVSSTLGGPAYLNPGVVLGNIIMGYLTFASALIFILMEFLAAGASIIVCVIFFWDSFKASKECSKRGIFSAYPVEKHILQNAIQELIATFFFFFILLNVSKNATGDFAPLLSGIIGFAVVFFLALSLNSTGYSMNAMRSFFSSIWFAILPIPNKNGEKVDWAYQTIVNLIASTISGILAVIVVGMM